MLHQDASTHAWLGGQPDLDLVVTMDDATSTLYSGFLVEEEGTASSFQGLLEVMLAHGVPCSLYTDRGSHYFHTPVAGGLVDKSRLTQVGRGLRQLGVEHIPAYSPEARGRSERMFGTLQDRLVKELALAGITGVAAANRWIKEVYLPAHNRRFAVPAALPDKAFTTVADPKILTEALCIEEDRVVSRDNTIAYGRLSLQLPQTAGRAHFVRCNVKVRAYPGGTLAVFLGPLLISRYSSSGVPLDPVPPKPKKVLARPSVAACSPPSRRGLATPEPGVTAERRPTLTAAARAAKRLPGQNERDRAT